MALTDTAVLIPTHLIPQLAAMEPAAAVDAPLNQPVALLTEAQRAEASLQFLLLDQDSDGRISSSELAAYLRTVGLFPTSAEVQGYLSMVDPESSGFITKEKALELVESLYDKRTTREEVHEAFRVLDDDADGYITTVQLRYILMQLGSRISQAETDEIIDDVEKDEDGLINIDDLINMMMSKNS